MVKATLPKGWRIVRLGSIFAEQTETNCTDLELLSVTGNRGIIPRSEIEDKDNSSEDKRKYLKVCKGDIAYNTMRMWQGVSALSEYNGIVSPAYTVLKPKDSVSAKFFAYFFKLPHTIFQFYRNSQGLVDDTRNLKYKNFAKISVSIPPLPEQRAIAEILTTTDKLIAIKEHFITIKQNQKQWLMKNLLTRKRKLSKFNEKWKTLKLREICDFISDGDWIESKDQSNDGYRLIQVGNIGINEYIDKSKSARFISEDTFIRLHCTEVLCGDVLLSRLPDPIGRSCLIRELISRAITAVDCTIIRFKTVLLAELFVQYASTNMYFSKIAKLSGGSTRTRIGRKEIENLLLCIPMTLPEQKAIADILTTADREIELLKKELEQQKLIKKYIMQQLLTGKIRVKGIIP